MLEEINNFMSVLPAGLKQVGLKPKEGLHVLLRFQEKDGTVCLDRNSVARFCLTRKATEFDYPFLQRCAELTQVSWCVNTNKCFDLPAKGIHSCSPYCVALKRESLEGGGKYAKDKIKIYDRINSYFANALALLNDDAEKERVKVFQYFINSKEKLDDLFGCFQQEFDEVKDKEYIILYLDEDIEKYRQVNECYLSDKLFNTNEFNVGIGDEVYGTSDFLNGFPTKKPFLSHQSATFDIAGRISGKMARNLYEFQDLMARNVLPRPLPMFIYREELKERMFAVLSKYFDEGERIGYQDIIRELYEKYKEDLGDYYLLYFYGGKVCDFDFVSKFRYHLQHGNKDYWEIKDYFNIAKGEKIHNVFELEGKVLKIIFNNSLIVETQAGGIQRKYFDELDAKYCKSENNYLLILKYRKAFYDYIYKSREQAITRQMFDHILLTGILEDIRQDEIKGRYHTHRWGILVKMNIWFSLSENFDLQFKNTNTMANQLQEHREFVKKLINKEADKKVYIENVEEYAFVAGMVIDYLFSKSNTADRSYRYLEIYIRQPDIIKLNAAIFDLFNKYKHANLSFKAKEAIAQVVSYNKENVPLKPLLPILLSGVLSPNSLLSNAEKKELAEEMEENIEI